MPCWVYVLRSERTGRRYVGQTDDLAARLNRHNEGLVFATAPYRPWRLIHAEQLDSRSPAMVREHFLKSGQGRQSLDQLEAGLDRPGSPGAG